MNKENKSNESIPQGGQQIIINQVEKKSQEQLIKAFKTLGYEL